MFSLYMPPLMWVGSSVLATDFWILTEYTFKLRRNRKHLLFFEPATHDLQPDRHTVEDFWIVYQAISLLKYLHTFLPLNHDRPHSRKPTNKNKEWWELTTLPDLPIHVSHAIHVSLHFPIPPFVDCACWHGNNTRVQNVTNTRVPEILPLTLLHAGTRCNRHDYGIDPGGVRGGCGCVESRSSVPVLEIPLPK